jgi:hypothetical protein
MWAAVSEKMGLEEREAEYEPVFAVTEKDDLTPEDDTVYLGEPNKNPRPLLRENERVISRSFLSHVEWLIGVSQRRNPLQFPESVRSLFVVLRLPLCRAYLTAPKGLAVAGYRVPQVVL